MISLRPKMLVHLRDRLQDRGAPASMVRPNLDITDWQSKMLIDEYGPLCEAMYLMMQADGDVDQAERDVIRGALRELDDRIRTEHFREMLRQAAERLEADGLDARVWALADAMGSDPVRCEVAFVLASAVAFADSRIAPEENSLLNDMADAFDISEEKADQLMGLVVGGDA